MALQHRNTWAPTPRFGPSLDDDDDGGGWLYLVAVLVLDRSCPIEQGEYHLDAT
jgi:hypothetical protein